MSVDVGHTIVHGGRRCRFGGVGTELSITINCLYSPDIALEAVVVYVRRCPNVSKCNNDKITVV